MKTKTKFGFYVREISAVVAAVLMTVVSCTSTINASARKVFIADANHYVNGAKIDFTNNRNSPGSVYVSFSGSSLYNNKIRVGTYLTFYGKNGQLLWKGFYSTGKNNMEMYCGTDVYRISASTTNNTESIVIDDGKNCRAR